MSQARDAILARVRQALRQPTDPHVRHQHDLTLPAAYQDRLRHYARVLPDPGLDFAAWKERFARMSEALTTRFIATTRDGVIEAVRALAAAEGWRTIAAQRHALIDPVAAALNLPRREADALADADVGLTVCDALVAQSGSVLLTARSAGGRAMSVLPPHHVVIATDDQLLPDLPTAYDLLHRKYGGDEARGWPSFMTLITGPSRTGDIERIIVLGAHGPKKLTVILAS